MGKSSLALELANWLGCSILSADSRQIYREMNVGTAKPSEAELQSIEHHFISEKNITDTWTAAMFEQEALKRLQIIFQKSDIAILCGGTGLYIKALCYGLDDIPVAAQPVREQLDRQFKLEGLSSLADQLRQVDPTYAANADLKNPRRVLRALAVFKTTGRTYSSYRAGQPKERPWKNVNILLDMERHALYECINNRVDEMISAGLEEEARSLFDRKNERALQTVGYQEWMPYFEGEYDREEAIRLIKRNTRRYAKRQGSWFRNQAEWIIFPATKRMQVRKHLSDVLSETLRKHGLH